MKTSLPDLDGIKPTTDAISKKDFLVVGINAFTRCLERGQMRAGVVCLSAKPELMTQHILMLTVVKNCPVMALQEFSPKLAPLLSIKSILALGFKVTQYDIHQFYVISIFQTLTEDVSADPFSEIVGHISMNAPPINIPWLTTVTKRSTEDCEEPDKKRSKLNHEDSKTTYMPLIVKQMITTKKTKKRNK